MRLIGVSQVACECAVSREQSSLLQCVQEQVGRRRPAGVHQPHQVCRRASRRGDGVCRWRGGVVGRGRSGQEGQRGDTKRGMGNRRRWVRWPARYRRVVETVGEDVIVMKCSELHADFGIRRVNRRRDLIRGIVDGYPTLCAQGHTCSTSPSVLPSCPSCCVHALDDMYRGCRGHC